MNEELKADLAKLEEYYDLFNKEIKEKEKKYKFVLDEYEKSTIFLNNFFLLKSEEKLF